MKAALKKIVDILAVAILPVFVAWYMARSAPDVRYTLLERVPVSAGSAQAPVETVQQLQVRNAGNAKAERIVVRVNKQVNLDNVTKYAESDQIRVTTTERSFQLEYPELPPDSGFSLVLRSPGNGIDTGDLNISHSAGRATEALAGRQTNSPGSVWFLVVSLFYLALIMRGLWKTLLEYLEINLRGNALAETLSRQAPWYLGDATWGRLQKAVTERQLADSHVFGADISRMASYGFLTADKPRTITEEDWTALTEKAIDRLSKGYKEAVNVGYVSSLFELIKTPRPRRFPSHKWELLVGNASERYLEDMRGKSFTSNDLLGLLGEKKPDEIYDKQWLRHIEQVQQKYISARESDLRFDTAALLSVLRQERPTGLDEKYWVRFMDGLRNRYISQVEVELQRSEAPLTRLRELDISVLSADSRMQLEGRARVLERVRHGAVFSSYESTREFVEKDVKPEWMEDSEYEFLRREAKSLLEGRYDANRYRKAVQSLSALLRREPLSVEKPGAIADSDWELLKECEEDILKLSMVENREKEIVFETERLAGERARVAELKDKIERQLRIIQDVLVDPRSLDRVEEYSNPFAIGNFANLKKVADALLRAPHAPAAEPISTQSRTAVSQFGAKGDRGTSEGLSGRVVEEGGDNAAASHIKAEGE